MSQDKAARANKAAIPSDLHGCVPLGFASLGEGHHAIRVESAHSHLRHLPFNKLRLPRLGRRRSLRCVKLKPAILKLALGRFPFLECLVSTCLAVGELGFDPLHDREEVFSLLLGLVQGVHSESEPLPRLLPLTLHSLKSLSLTRLPLVGVFELPALVPDLSFRLFGVGAELGSEFVDDAVVSLTPASHLVDLVGERRVLLVVLLDHLPGIVEPRGKLGRLRLKWCGWSANQQAGYQA